MRGALDRAERLLDQVRREMAPDPRLAVFEVRIEMRGEVLTLVGATSEPAAAEALHRRIAALDAWRAVSDRIARLPEAEAGEAIHAVVTAAVAPLLAGPMIAETQVSQAVLGTHLTVLRRHGRWLQCRAADGYLGWVHAGYVGLMDETAARAWELGNRGETWLSLGAEVLDADGEAMVRLPWGARFVREHDGAARLPDGRHGQAVGAMVASTARAAAYPREGQAVCETAAGWMGVPYLWGGVTQGGVDCSGYVQAVYRMHGVDLPRDADLQSRAGEPLDPGERFESLEAGDLLFFTEEPGRCTHVAMSTGGSRILHSSLGNGGVARNDLNGRRNYERELAGLFLSARRVL